MLEKYTPDAKRVIFFARYEASRAGATTIDIEHLVLGIGRVDKRLARQLPNFHPAPAQPWWRGFFQTRPRISTAVPIPFSGASKQTLAAVIPNGADEITPKTLAEAIVRTRQED